MNREAIEERLERNQIPHDAALAEKLEIYLRLLQEWNARMDLTATLEAAETADSAGAATGSLLTGRNSKTPQRQRLTMDSKS